MRRLLTDFGNRLLSEPTARADFEAAVLNVLLIHLRSSPQNRRARYDSERSLILALSNLGSGLDCAADIGASVRSIEAG